MYKTFDYWSRDMLNFNFSEKRRGLFLHQILRMIFQEKCFCYFLLTEQISLSDCFYFSKYEVCEL